GGRRPPALHGRRATRTWGPLDPRDTSDAGSGNGGDAPPHAPRVLGVYPASCLRDAIHWRRTSMGKSSVMGAFNPCARVWTPGAGKSRGDSLVVSVTGSGRRMIEKRHDVVRTTTRHCQRVGGAAKTSRRGVLQRDTTAWQPALDGPAVVLRLHRSCCRTV